MLQFQEKGYITLLSVLVLGAIGTSVAISIILSGLNSSKTSFALEQANQAQALANTCAEEALQEIRDLTLFEGSDNIILGQGNCDYTVINLGDENREIQTIGTVGTIVKKTKIIIDTINPQINITSWQEVNNF